MNELDRIHSLNNLGSDPKDKADIVFERLVRLEKTVYDLRKIVNEMNSTDGWLNQWGRWIDRRLVEVEDNLGLAAEAMPEYKGSKNENG